MVLLLRVRGQGTPLAWSTSLGSALRAAVDWWCSPRATRVACPCRLALAGGRGSSDLWQQALLCGCCARCVGALLAWCFVSCCWGSVYGFFLFCCSSTFLAFSVCLSCLPLWPCDLVLFARLLLLPFCPCLFVFSLALCPVPASCSSFLPLMPASWPFALCLFTPLRLLPFGPCLCVSSHSLFVLCRRPAPPLPCAWSHASPVCVCACAVVPTSSLVCAVSSP